MIPESSNPPTVTSTATLLSRITVSVGAVGAGMAALAVVDAFRGYTVLPVFPYGSVPPAALATLAAFTVSVGLFGVGSRFATVKIRVAVAATMTLVLSAMLLSIATHLLASVPESLDTFHSIRWSGGTTLALASASLLAAATGRGRDLAGLLGLGLLGVTVFISLGIVYGGMFTAGRESPATVYACAYCLLTSTGLMTVGGPTAWPNRVFVGDSVRAVMMRWLLPLVALAVLVTDLATVKLFSNVSPALGSSLNTVVSCAAAVAIIYSLGSLIQKRLERSATALRSSEEKFERVFKSVPAGLAVSRVDDGRLIEVNDEFVRIYGFTRNEVIGKTSQGLGLWLNPSDRSNFIRQVAAVGGEVRDTELRMLTKDGRAVVIRTASQLLDFEGEKLLISSFVDVTERKKTEDALKLSELKFGTIFQKSPVGLTVTDFDTDRFVEVNDAYVKHVGAASADELLGKSIIEMGVLTAETKAEIIAAIADGRTHRLVVPARRLSGEPRVSEVSITGYEENGRRFILTGSMDVTERERLEREARTELVERRRTQRQLDLALEAANIGIWMMDPATRRLRADNRLWELYRIKPEADGAVPFDEWASRVNRQDIPRMQRYIERVARGGPQAHTEFRLRLPDGSERHIHGAATLLPAEGDQPARLVGLNIDITTRVLAEIELRKHQEDLETLVATRTKELQRANFLSTTALDLSKAGYWHVPLDGSGDWFSSERIVEMHGDPPSEGMRYSLEFWAAQVNAADAVIGESTAATFAAACAGDVPRYDVTYAYKRPADGRIVWEHAIGDVIRDANGTPTDMYGVSQDVTEFKNYELVLRAAKDAAESANRAKGVFLAHMSHEIRTPLNAILGYAQLLERDTTLDESQRRKVGAIHSSGDHLLTLLNDVLEMSRIEAGRVTLSREPFDLHELVDSVRLMFTELISRRGLGFHVQLTSGLVRVLHGDAGKVRQVLINLVGNAAKFTERGSITMRVTSRETESASCEVTVDVLDTGPGIAPSDRDAIFSPFQQSDAGRNKGGTGLGLPISRNFARLMGGNLVVRSIPGEGSTFTFTFQGEVESTGVVMSRPAGRAQRLASSENGLRALVVDDVLSNRELLEETLTSAGFLTRSVNSGERAIAVHAEWHPDVIFMDLHMPGMGGIAAIRHLREQDTSTPIIVVTAAAKDVTAHETEAAGANGFLQKPYRDVELYEVIARAAGIRMLSAPTPMSSAAVDAVDVGSLDIRELLHRLPPELVTELRDACRQARATKLLQLADRAAMHSELAATAIRNAANAFRYDMLHDALDGALS